MLSSKSYPMENLSFEEENELMLKHLGFVFHIPFHINPITMSVSKNPHINEETITIMCETKSKTENHRRITYNFRKDKKSEVFILCK